MRLGSGPQGQVLVRQNVRVSGKAVISCMSHGASCDKLSHALCPFYVTDISIKLYKV